MEQQFDPEVLGPALGAGILGLACVGLLVALAIGLVICFILHGCLKRIPEEHRKMQPGMVFLLLIPVFNLVWNFFVYLQLPDSFRGYFESQGRTDLGDCGRGIGLAYAICAAVSIIPYLNCLSSIAALVLLIVFLVRLLREICGFLQGLERPPCTALDQAS